MLSDAAKVEENDKTRLVVYPFIRIYSTSISGTVKRSRGLFTTILGSYAIYYWQQQTGENAPCDSQTSPPLSKVLTISLLDNPTEKK